MDINDKVAKILALLEEEPFDNAFFIIETVAQKYCGFPDIPKGYITPGQSLRMMENVTTAKEPQIKYLEWILGVIKNQ